MNGNHIDNDGADCMKHSGQWQYLRGGKRFCLGCLEEQQETMKIRNEAWAELYHAVNKMMLRLGVDGEINAQQAEAENVMTALHGIDGGRYNTKFSGI
jgi:hypothetical protein